MGVAVGQTYLAKAADPRVRVDANADGRAVLVVQAFAKIVYVNTCDLHKRSPFLENKYFCQHNSLWVSSRAHIP